MPCSYWRLISERILITEIINKMNAENNIKLHMIEWKKWANQAHLEPTEYRDIALQRIIDCLKIKVSFLIYRV